MVESWLERLGQHERVTVTNRELLDWVLTFHIGDKPPVVCHFIVERLAKHEQEEKRIEVLRHSTYKD